MLSAQVVECAFLAARCFIPEIEMHIGGLLCAGPDVERRACRRDATANGRIRILDLHPWVAARRLFSLSGLRLKVSYFIQIHKYASIKITPSGAISGSEPQTDARLCCAY